MPAALKPFATAGVALVGASLITVAPIELQSSGVLERAVTQDYSLTAASSGLPVTSALPDSSLFYVPINLLNMALSVPAWEVQAMNQFADGMIQTGSWQVWSPTNVFGFDEADPPKLKGFINMLLPIQPFSSVLGQQVSWWAQANLPMNAGCAALPGACPDPAALLNSMFKVSILDLMKGYTFPTVTNPFTGEKTTWSNTPVKLDPFEAFTNTWKYLTAKPTGPETVTPEYTLATTVKLVKSVFDDFYPFVQNSEYFNDQQTGLAPLFRALAPLLCPTCDPKNPYDNPYLYDNYPPKGVTVDATAATDAAAPADAARVTRPTPVKTAIENLVKKFQAGSTSADSTVATDSTASTGTAATGTDGVTPASKPVKGFGLGALPTFGASAAATGSADASDAAAAAPAKPTWGIGKHRASDDGTSPSTGSSGKAGTSGSSDASGSSAKSATSKSDTAKSDKSGTAETSRPTKKSGTTGASEKSSSHAKKAGSSSSAGAKASSSATAGGNASGGSEK